MRFFFYILLIIFCFPSMSYAQCSFTVEGDNPISDYCFEASANLNYTLTGTPAGGTFSGNHVSGNIFNPPITGFIGEFDITYTVDACAITETITIGTFFTINGESGNTFCLNDAPFGLQANIAGGTFSGEDVIGAGFAPSEAGQYDLTYTTSNGCAITRTIEIGPSFGIEGMSTGVGNLNICSSSLPIVLTGIPSGGTFSGPGYLGGQFNPAIVPGSFNITYTITGCGSVTQTIMVDGVGENATIDESSLSLQYCETDETLITPMGNLGEDADFFINGSLITSFQPSNLGVGTYELFYSFEGENGCNSLDSYTFNVFPPPNPTFDLPEQYCIAGDAVPLMSLAGVSGNSIFQGIGVVTTDGVSVFDPNIAGLGTHSISHQITDNIGLCQAEITQEITIMPEVEAIFDGFGSVGCFTGRDKLFYTGSSRGNDVAYFWNLIEGTAIIEVSLSGPADTVEVITDSPEIQNFTIELEVTNGGCSATFQQTFNEVNVTVDILTENQSIEAGQTVSIEANASSTNGNTVELQWQPNQSLSCNDCLAPIAAPTQTTTYVLLAQNETDCIVADSVRIEVLSDISEEDIVIPTAFSPNEDNVNDCFKVVGEGIASVQLKVYSRWGGKAIFEGDGLKGWDGLHNLRFVDQGVYVYLAEIVLDSGAILQRQGYVMVLK
ncbi:MAG: gliding motility-associated C-terminal domain-containing protein [Chitinophagales bacterium]